MDARARVGRIGRTVGDGNCFFRAIEGALRASGRVDRTHEALRRDLWRGIAGAPRDHATRLAVEGHVLAAAQALEDLAARADLAGRTVALRPPGDRDARAAARLVGESERRSVLGVRRPGSEVDAPVAALLGAFAGWRVDLAFLPGFARPRGRTVSEADVVVADLSALRRRFSELAGVPSARWGRQTAHLTLLATRGHFEWIEWEGTTEVPRRAA